MRNQEIEYSEVVANRLLRKKNRKQNKINNLLSRADKKIRPILNENDIEDIECALIQSIMPRDVPCNTTGGVSYVRHGDHIFASLYYLDKNGEIAIKHGVSVKRKFDVYNQKLGQLIALINIRRSITHT